MITVSSLHPSSTYKLSVPNVLLAVVKRLIQPIGHTTLLFNVKDVDSTLLRRGTTLQVAGVRPLVP